MNYELAKKLKDAGFSFIECHLETCPYVGGSLDDSGKNYHYPSLEELIEACGEEFKGLIYGESYEVGKPWGAYRIILGYECGLNSPETEGSTPSEAVANLWLELNKKQ